MNGAEKNHHQEFCNPFTRFSEVPATYPELAKEEIDIFADGMSLEVQCAFECFRKKIKCKNVKCAGRKKAESTIQWGGGSAGSWCDMVCISCGAIYEVKSKNPSGVEKIQNKSYIWDTLVWTARSTERSPGEVSTSC